MKNSNANNTILFMEKKKEFENNKHSHNFNEDKIIIKDKNAQIISLSNYKRLKFKINHTKKENNFNIDTIKKKVFLIVIIALFLLIFASTAMKQKLSSEVPSNTFVAQSAEIDKAKTSTYNSIIKRVVCKYTDNSYNVSISQLHQNGNLVYAQGYFDVPKKGKVTYDLILKDDSPTSLIINGNEYIKIK